MNHVLEDQGARDGFYEEVASDSLEERMRTVQKVADATGGSVSDVIALWGVLEERRKNNLAFQDGAHRDGHAKAVCLELDALTEAVQESKGAAQAQGDRCDEHVREVCFQMDLIGRAVQGATEALRSVGGHHG